TGAGPNSDRVRASDESSGLRLFMKKNLMVGAAAACILTACGERAEKWDARVDRNARSLGLVGSVVVLDEPLNRALILSSPSRHSMSQRAFKVGKNVAAIAASADKDTLF